MKIVEFDTIYLSYDEPNAEQNYADLLTKVPWAERVHGVKGSDAAHKAAAELSETDWFVSVDADNIVDSAFFNLDINMSDPAVKVYGWCGENVVNGLRYGNGGLKLWNREFVLNMKTHEASESDRAQVDFCWEDGYKNSSITFSKSFINASPFQAWRAGFREGVKMSLLDGIKVPASELTTRVWWHNIHRLKQWSTVGSHDENGIYAVLGARQGVYYTNCTDWNYVDVRDFEYLKQFYDSNVPDNKHDAIKLAKELANPIQLNTGINLPWLDESQSKYTLDLYNETIELCKTYRG